MGKWYFNCSILHVINVLDFSIADFYLAISLGVIQGRDTMVNSIFLK